MCTRQAPHRQRHRVRSCEGHLHGNPPSFERQTECQTAAQGVGVGLNVAQHSHRLCSGEQRDSAVEIDCAVVAGRHFEV